jgi:PhnB protein
MATKPIPEGFHTITPYLVVRNASGLIEFMKKAFGAQEIFCMRSPDGIVQHGEIRIGDSIIELGEASEQYPPMPCMLHMYVEDADVVYRRALEAGATSNREMRDECYGDRTGGVTDPSGNKWFIATHKEDVTPEELERRMAAESGQQ